MIEPDVDIDPDTEDLLRRRLHQLAAYATEEPTTTTGTTTTSTSADAAALVLLERAGRRRRWRRPVAAVVALAAAAAVVAGVAGLVRTGDGPSSRTVAAVAPEEASPGLADLGTAPPYAALSGTRWTVTAMLGDDGLWHDVAPDPALPFDGQRVSIGFVAGYAYGSTPCGDWITNGISPIRLNSQCSFPPMPVDPVMVQGVVEQPVEVSDDGQVLTVLARSYDGTSLVGIRADRDGGAAAQVISKQALADTVWGIRAAGGVLPDGGEDLAWIQVAPEAAGAADVSPTCSSGVAEPTDVPVPVRCVGDARQRTASDAVLAAWDQVEQVTLTADELVIAGLGGEVRARLIAGGPAAAPPGVESAGSGASSKACAGTVVIIPPEGELPGVELPHCASPSVAPPTSAPNTTTVGESSVNSMSGAFDAPGEEPVATAEVTGRSFRVVALVDADGRSVPTVDSSLVVFSEGRVTGGVGCHLYAGTYPTEPDAPLTITSLSRGPSHDCGDEAQAEADALIEALAHGTPVWRDGDLVWRTEAGLEAILRPETVAASPAPSTTSAGGASPSGIDPRAD